MNALRKEVAALGPPPKIGREQRNVRTSGKIVSLAERRIHAAGVDIALEDE
jgi:hypothetical protein